LLIFIGREKVKSGTGCQAQARQIAHRFRQISARTLMATLKDASGGVDLAAAIAKLPGPK